MVRGIALLLAFLVVGVAACGGPEDITSSSQLLGRWDHSDGGTMPAEKVTFEKDTTTGMTSFIATVALTATRFTGATFEVTPDALVLVYPADPANTTWCSPGATLEDSTLCFEDFGSVCDAIPGRPGVASPLSGCFTKE
jgi:hypothetical protein